MSTDDNKNRNTAYSARKSSWLQLYLHGLNVSVRGNAQAFGYSILITVSFGIVSTRTDKPTPLELIGFAMSAVAAFTVLNMFVAWLKTIQPDDIEHMRVMLVATATDFLSVGAGLAAAFAINRLVQGWAPWVLVPFSASLAYCLVQALQIALTRHVANDSD